MGTRDKTLLRRLDRENEELKKKIKELKQKASGGEKLEEMKSKLKKKEAELEEAKEKSDLEDLTKADLKAILKNRDEKTSGSKKKLIERVKNG